MSKRDKGEQPRLPSVREKLKELGAVYWKEMHVWIRPNPEGLMLLLNEGDEWVHIEGVLAQDAKEYYDYYKRRQEIRIVK